MENYISLIAVNLNSYRPALSCVVLHYAAIRDRPVQAKARVLLDNRGMRPNP